MNYIDIYNELKKDIIFFKIKPGEIISETELTKRFKISRTPVRDIIKKLADEGFLEVIPQKGTFVTHIDTSMIYEVMYLREVLEIAVSYELMEKINPEQLVSLRLIVSKQRYLNEKDLNDEEKAGQFLDLDDEFHEKLFKIANKKFLWEIVAKAKSHYFRVRYLTNITKKETLLSVCDQHDLIIDMIEEKNKEKLNKVYHEHIYDLMKDLKLIINDFKYYFKM